MDAPARVPNRRFQPGEALGDPLGAQETSLVSCVGSLGGISSRVEKH